MALTNAQHDLIMRSYEQKQLHNQNILLKRYKEIHERIPEVKELEDSISSLSVQQARKLLDGDTHALDTLHTEIHELRMQKATLLKFHGYPDNYLETPYECPLCKDTGYIDGRKCTCFKKLEIDFLYTQSNLQEILQEENFDNFRLDYYSGNYIEPQTGENSLSTIKEVLRVCHNFIDNFGCQFNNLFFYGKTGVGKTFLSNCIAKELISKSYSVIYFTAFQLFDIFEKSKFEKDEAAVILNAHIFDCDLLIIDDLGTEFSNSFTTSQFFLCLNERLLRKKSTIISTNLGLDTILEYYSQRTFSRITSNYEMLKIVGDDIRIKKKLMNREEL